jgi:serine/threonine-protein kinase
MIGTTVGKYRIVEKLGRGGMGTVYRAVDETLDRDVAIKVLNPDLTDEAVLKRFRAEAVTLARLNHPGIATIYELHHHHDDLLMVMEFVRGETFHDLSDRLGPLAPPQAAHLCMQVLDALGHAHRGGVVHRDLKPANLMITDAGIVKVMDFGIARVLGTEHFTHGGYMMGTPAYMAPEQVLGREIDGRADLYSVGVVCYRLLSGRLPFSADTAISMVQMQISEPPTPIVSIRPNLPEWCGGIVERALAKSPSDRFQSAEEFRAALAGAVTPQALGEMPTISTPTPPGIAIERDVTLPYRTPTAVRASGALAISGSVPLVPSVPSVPSPTGPTVPAAAPVPTPTPTNIPLSERTTTTVVLGRTHLAALGALLLIVAIGIAVLAFAALRRGSGQQPPLVADSQLAPTTAPATPGPVTEAAPAATPPAPASGAALPSVTSAPGQPPAPATGKPATPADGGVATAGTKGARGSSSSGVSLGGSPTKGPAPASSTTAAPATPITTPTTPVTAPPTTPVTPPATPPPAPAAPALPTVTFDDVRVLISENGKAREREGILRLGDGHVVVHASLGGAPIVSIANSVLRGIFYSRSKQPKWRDASGQEVESRIDLGPMGFFRGDRNWIILQTRGEPVILRIEDSAMKTVLPALEVRTGHKVQR